MTFEVKLLITFVATHPLVILTKFGQNRMKHVEEEANCEKKERKKERTRKTNKYKQDYNFIQIMFFFTYLSKYKQIT